MADHLTTWIESLGRSEVSIPPDHVATADAWLDCAHDRPAWSLWGKADPATICPAHPLLCHMLDVTAVAARLLTAILPLAMRRRLLRISADEVAAIRALLFLIALHDFGKATPAFQAKVDWARVALPPLGFDLCADRGARHHGDIGFFFLKTVLEDMGATPSVALTLARAVTAHHGQFPTNTNLKQPSTREQGREPMWEMARTGIVEALASFLGIGSLLGFDEVDHAYVVLLAGLTSVADWIGSMQDVFTYEPPQESLACYWPIALRRADQALAVAGMRPAPVPAARSFGELFPQFTAWPLHHVADQIARSLREPSLIVVEAPMGEGKTEAALVLANAAAAHVGQNGLYIGLPTQATANQMLGRVEKFLRETRPQQTSNLLLAHGEAALVERFQRLILAAVYNDDSDRQGAVTASEWFLSKKRRLLADFAVGTIDQALLSVMLVPHAFVRIYGLAGKTVILDEVHAYDTYTGTLLDRLVEWLAAAGTTVVLLSATLPSARRAALMTAYRKGAGLGDEPPGDSDYPRISTTSRAGTFVESFSPRAKSVAVSVERVTDDIDQLAGEVITCVREGGCVGWICNTVARAQAATRCVRDLAANVSQRLLIHSRLLPEDRSRRETLLERWLGPETRTTERPERCIVIGTQVLEQSLDVDFDLLVTDVAPIDLILQRAGRLWRHQRSNRSTSHHSPRLLVACPEGTWQSARLDQVAVVYAELLVRRTLKVLDGRAVITLPDDIAPLVEEVYADAIVPADDELYGACIDHHGGKATERILAEQKLMPHPFIEDDPFGALRVYLDETDDPMLHDQLRAETRLGPPSVEVVCLKRRGEQLFVGDGDDTPLDLSKGPGRELIARLVRRSIGVSMRSLVHALVNDRTAKPQSWRGSALLRYRRFVGFEDGQAVVGDITLTLDSELGLCIELPRRS